MINVIFGCGLSIAQNWNNYDASPTLRLQRTPFISTLARKFIKPQFPDLVCYGDVCKGLPEKTGNVDYVYCSHVLEHLGFENFRKALAEVMRVLKHGRVFRCVLPDLEFEIKNIYLIHHPMPVRTLCDLRILGFRKDLKISVVDCI